MTNFLSNIIAKLMVLIYIIPATLFPDIFVLQHQQIYNVGTRYMPEIVEAVKDEDTDTLENLMCKNIKENVANVSGGIQNMYDLIENEVVDITWEELPAGRSFYIHDNKHQITIQVFEIYITTQSEKYKIMVDWEYINTYDPDELGIRRLQLFKVKEDGHVERLYTLKGTDFDHSIEISNQ